MTPEKIALLITEDITNNNGLLLDWWDHKDVMIYDRFAHIGKIELYNFNGTPRQNRSSK